VIGLAKGGYDPEKMMDTGLAISFDALFEKWPELEIINKKMALAWENRLEKLGYGGNTLSTNHENSNITTNDKAIVFGNRTIKWFIALTIGILVVIAYNKFRTFDDFEKNPEKQSPVLEHSLPINDLNDSKVSYAPFEYTINEHQPQFIKDAQTSLSVVFQNIDGEDFVSLNISPIGEQSFVRAVLSGNTEEFKSSVGVFNVQILSIDYSSKKVVVQVSRKS
jgi:hypothetical protein